MYVFVANDANGMMTTMPVCCVRLWTSWFPWLLFCGCWRNLEFTITMHALMYVWMEVY